MEHFNKLSPAENERLALISEECGEVIQIIGKIQRHGYESYSPFDPEYTTNRTLFEKELADLSVVLGVLYVAKDVDIFKMLQFAEAKVKRLDKYLHHNSIPSESNTKEMMNAIFGNRPAS